MKGGYFFTTVAMLCIVAIVMMSGTCSAQQKKAEVKNMNEELYTLISEARENREALNKLLKYSVENPANEEVLNALASIYAMTDMAKAEKYANQALALNPKNGHAYGVLAQLDRSKAEDGRCIGEKRQLFLESAMTKVKKALESNPDDPWINVEAALIFNALNDKVGAKAAIERAAELKPDNEDIKKMKTQIISSAK